MTHGIYRIFNLIDGIAYVGASNKVPQRLNSHRSALRLGKHHNRRLQADWNALGAQAFLFQQIESIADLSDVGRRERLWIIALDACDPARGYNLNRGDVGAPGIRQPISPEHREKLLAANKRRWADPAYKERVSKAIGDAHRNKSRPPHSAERREKIAAANRARAPEQVGRPLSLEIRAKMSATRTGKKHSEETRAKMAEARRIAWAKKKAAVVD